MLEIQGVTKIYGGSKSKALDSVDLRVENGEILGFAGLNGAGKTTALKIIAGAILPTEGTVKVDQFDVVRDKPEASAGIGYVSEYPNYDLNYKPMSLMKYFAGFCENPEYRKEDYLLDILDKVGLTPFLRKKLRTYSQGMRKRFSLAAAMIGEPNNYLLDETMSNLDPEGVRFVRNMILGIKKSGKAVMLSSHILGELGNLADRVAVLHKGKLISVIEGSELHSRAKSNVEVQLENADGRTVNILAKYGEVTFDKDIFTIANAGGEKNIVNKISSDLISNGYLLNSISRMPSNLEKIFFERLGDQP